VPLAVNVVGNIAYLSDTDHGQFLLFDLYIGKGIDGYRPYLYGEYVVMIYVKYIQKLNVTAMYISNDLDLRYLSKQATLRISKIQYGPQLFPYGICNDQEIINYLFYVTNKSQKRYTGYRTYANLEKIFSGTVEPIIDKVSASHLRHMSIYELRQFGFEYFRKNVEFALPLLDKIAAYGIRESFLVGVLIWCCTLSKVNRQLMHKSGIWLWDITSETDFYTRIKKDFSQRLKAVQNLLEIDMTQFFEMEVLVNRGVGSVDWEAERLHRVRPNTCNINAGIIYKEATNLFQRLLSLNSKPQKSSWDSYWAGRWQWSPTGAYHSQYDSDNQYKAKSRLLRHKFFAFNRMPDISFEEMIGRKPEIVAWPSVKCEWGKQRAIYGVDATSFIISGYGFAGCEEALSALFPIGPAATEDNVSKTVNEVLRNGVPYCFDYEDFNSQHTHDSMQAVLTAYREVFKTKLYREQIEAIDWTILSIHNSRILAEGGDYTTRGTLLSGWRLTSFVNTILNYIYAQVALQGTGMVSTHNGDDVLAGVSTYKQVQQLQKGAAMYNIRFQKSKCYLGAIAEFLRVDHRVGTGAQYLARGVSTFVHGPTEATIPNDLCSVLSSIKTRAQELVDRGAYTEIVKYCKMLQHKHLCKLWNVSLEEISIIERTHVSLGGLNTDIVPGGLVYKIERVQQRYLTDEDSLDDAKADLPGVHAYARKLTRRLIDNKYYTHIVSAARKAILAASVAVKFGVKLIKIELPDHCIEMNAQQYGMYKHESLGIKTIMAKSLNIPLIAINADWNYLSSLLASEKDQLKAMKILF